MANDRISKDRILELERQTAIAFAALGASVGEALVAAGTGRDVLDILCVKSRGLFTALQQESTVPAATMFGAFTESLCEKVEHRRRSWQ